MINGDSVSPKVPPEDGVTRPFYLGGLYKGQFDPLVLASGVDARLYEAEGKLRQFEILKVFLTGESGAPPLVVLCSAPLRERRLRNGEARNSVPRSL